MNMILATLLSATISSLLLYILNNRICGVFRTIQVDLRKLSNRNRRILSFLGFVLSIFVVVFLRISLQINSAISGIILGILGSIIDTCFDNNIIENFIESKS